MMHPSSLIPPIRPLLHGTMHQHPTGAVPLHAQVCPALTPHLFDVIQKGKPGGPEDTRKVLQPASQMYQALQQGAEAGDSGTGVAGSVRCASGTCPAAHLNSSRMHCTAARMLQKEGRFTRTKIRCRCSPHKGSTMASQQRLCRLGLLLSVLLAAQSGWLQTDLPQVVG